MSLSSLKQRLLPPSLSPKNWRAQIRATTALGQLESGHWDQFPLSQVQALTDTLIQTSSKKRYLGLGGVEPRSDDCHTLVVLALDGFKNELWAYAAGVVACLHVVTDAHMFGQLEVLRDLCDDDTDFFLLRAKDYLQCLLLACKSKPEFFHTDGLRDLANNLLLAVTDYSKLPPMMRSLNLVGHDACEMVLPLDFVKRTLQYTNYKENLGHTLKPLVDGRKWRQVYDLLDGLGHLVQNKAARRLRPDIFAEHLIPIWAAWSPNLKRISTWGGSIPEELMQKLAPILDLEGPDFQGVRPLGRCSSAGVFGPGLLHLPPRGDKAILDHILDVFDLCISKGNEAIRLFITLCVEPRTLNWQVVERLETALKLDSPSHIDVLDSYVRSFRQGDSLHTIRCFTRVFRVLQSSTALQNAFGSGFNLQQRSWRVFYQAQRQLRNSFLQGEVNEAYAHQLSNLGHEMLAAEWLHRTWTPTYIERLRMVPRNLTIASLLRSMDKAPGDLRDLLQEFLVLTLYSSRIEGRAQLQLKTVSAISLELNDPAWQVSLEDEGDREKLRDMMLVAMIRGFAPAEATSCLRQADSEEREIVHSIRRILEGYEEDVVCIALAKFLAADFGTRRPAEAWLQLLMHLMRQTPPGLHLRCAERLPLGPWEVWTRHLDKLFKGQHFDPEGGIGFTVEGFERIRTEKRGVSRMASTSTYSTASTGRYYETSMSFR